MAEPKCILLAEDNPEDVELTLSALEDIQLANEVAVVSDGAEALDYLRGRGRFKERTPGNPVLVLLDVKMPKVDGLEVLREMKADESLSSIPVVIMTSSPDELDTLTSIKLGVMAYVEKPIDLRRFTRSIKDFGLYWALTNEPPRKANL